MRQKSFQCLASGTSWISFSWLVTFLSDRFFETPQSVRLLILAICSLGILYLIFQLIRSNHTNSSLIRLSKQVRDVYPIHGEKLLGLVEIAGNKKDPLSSKTTISLLKAEQAKLEKEILSLDVASIFPFRRNRSVYTLLSILVFIPAMVAFTFPELAKNSTERWMMPWKQTKKITLTQLLLPDTEIIVPRNESFILRVPFSPTSRSFPLSAYLSTEHDSYFSEISFSNEHFFEFTVPPLSQGSTFQLRCGDFRHAFRVTPNDRPLLRGLKAQVQWPRYLKYPPTEVNLLTDKLSYLKGSKISIQGETDKSLSSIALQSSHWRSFHSPQSHHFFFDPPPLQEDQNLEIRFEDENKISQQRKYLFNLEVLEDEAPASEFDKTADLSPILEFETRAVTCRAKDDLGIFSYHLSLEITKRNQTIIKHDLISQELKETNKTELEISFPFTPSFFDLKSGDQATFTLAVSDRFPQRKASQSTTIQIPIIGSQEHAQFITRKMEELLGQLAEISREQESLQSKTIQHQSQLLQSPKKEQSIPASSSVSTLAEKQEWITQELSSSTQAGLKLIESATQNPIFDSSTLQGFSDSVKEMDGISSEPMTLSTKALRDIMNAPRTETNRLLTESVQNQENALLRLKKLIETLSNQKDRIEARSLSQRLRDLGQREKTIALKLMDLLPHTLGKISSSLSKEHLMTVKALHEDQQLVRENSVEVQHEISRYYERTGVPEYQKVNLLMSSSNLQTDLKLIAQRINENISLQALKALSTWQVKFQTWAEILENQITETQQGGGEGSSSGKDMASEILALLKIKKKQKNIILKTQYINQSGVGINHALWSLKLSKFQNELTIDLTDAQIALANEALNPLLDEAHTAMSRASESLQQKDTGGKTQAQQFLAKDLVSDIINLLMEGQQNNAETDTSEEVSMMEFLLMQAKSEKSKKGKGKSEAAGKTGGGNNQGGKAKNLQTQIEGKNIRQKPSSRKPKTFGGSIPLIPQEFKESMKRYLQKVKR